MMGHSFVHAGWSVQMIKSASYSITQSSRNVASVPEKETFKQTNTCYKSWKLHWVLHISTFKEQFDILGNALTEFTAARSQTQPHNNVANNPEIISLAVKFERYLLC